MDRDRGPVRRRLLALLAQLGTTGLLTALSLRAAAKDADALNRKPSYLSDDPRASVPDEKLAKLVDPTQTIDGTKPAVAEGHTSQSSQKTHARTPIRPAARVLDAEATDFAKKYVFDDGDDPGIIQIPRAWQSSFAVGDSYTVWVAPERTIYISLENEDAIALPGAAYQVDFVDGSKRQGQLGSSGVARLTGVPDGPFAVSYPDQADLLARSIAASMRQAFDQQGTGPLFFMLGQSPDVVQQAVAVYEQYSNDLTGRGLTADIDQVVTDPDARPPLAFLRALAGIPVDGTDGAIIQNGSPAASDAG